MNTTAMYTEIIVIGTLAGLCLTVAALLFIPLPAAKSMFFVVKDNYLMFAMPLLISAYSFGWLLNFLAHQIFEPFDTRIRRVLLKNHIYRILRLEFLHKGGERLVALCELDRHIMRIARANVIIFAVLSVFSLTRLCIDWVPMVATLAGLSGIISALSFWQWRTRCVSHYRVVMDTHRLLTDGHK